MAMAAGTASFDMWELGVGRGVYLRDRSGNLAAAGTAKEPCDGHSHTEEKIDVLLNGEEELDSTGASGRSRDHPYARRPDRELRDPAGASFVLYARADRDLLRRSGRCFWLAEDRPGIDILALGSATDSASSESRCCLRKPPALDCLKIGGGALRSGFSRKWNCRSIGQMCCVTARSVYRKRQ